MTKFNFDHVSMAEIQTNHEKINHIFETSMNHLYPAWKDELTHEEIKRKFILFYEGMCYGVTAIEWAYLGKIVYVELASDLNSMTKYIYKNPDGEMEYQPFQSMHSKESESFLNSVIEMLKNK